MLVLMDETLRGLAKVRVSGLSSVEMYRVVIYF